MTKDKLYLKSVAEKICIPAIEKAINNLYLGSLYLITDHVGYECTKLEELLRPLWGIAPLLRDEKYYINVNGEKTELASALRKVILEGSDENSNLCFSRFAENSDDASFANQMITEFSAYCLALVIAREALWDPYSDAEKTQVGNWIKEWAVKALRDSWRNNHFWFPILSVTALCKIGIDCGDVNDMMNDGFSVLDEMYISDGWYQDGCFGRFDFYISWSHHVYPLLWIYLAEGTPFFDSVRAETYKKRSAEFFDYYCHMFDFDGSVPAFGRSLSYRFAESSYFAAAAFVECNIDYGTARRALVKNVSYFMENMTISGDNVLQPGYMYPSEAVAENYTSSGGAYWCAKTFLCLALPDSHPFWNEADKPLPIERGDFLINSVPEKINLLLEGTKNAGVTLYNNSSSYHNFGFYGGLFNDMGGYYSKFVYNSRALFGISTADNISLDNMISLETNDSSMCSRRTGFTDEGYVDGVLVSTHIPFANDKNSYIKTFIVPLGDGYHFRAHKVTLSGEYRIIEGGFSVANSDDNRKTIITDSEIICTDGYGKFSGIFTLSSVPFNYYTRSHNPGLHLLAPQSRYPAYRTDTLSAGEYFFASVFSLTTEDIPIDKPEITLFGNKTTVKYKNINKEIILD